MLKDRLSPLLRPAPQYSAVAIAPPQGAVAVHLSWPGGCQDVTADHTIASLRPLTIALGVDAGPVATLDFSDGRGHLGSLGLTNSGSLAAAGLPIWLYRVANGSHRCLPWAWRIWNLWLQDRAARSAGAEHNFRLEPAALQQLMVCYICPRPVALVSVAVAGHFNMFPMDLIGSVGPHVTLALRSTNISIPVLREAGRAALASLPAEMKRAAYDLGRHHQQPLGDPAALPFATRPSPTAAIPMAAAALHAREVVIRHAEDIGSHAFLVADILFDGPVVPGRQLHHVSGIYQAHRRLRGAAFPQA